MVQVDIFWSFGIGAGFAVAAAQQIEQTPKEEEPKPFWRQDSFVHALLFVSVLFAPSGAYLLAAFPSWETMHVAADGYVPAWLVALFGMTNITQGILGYWVAHTLIRKGKKFGAGVAALCGYFGMFFILVHGWDGRGYQRFFSARPEALNNWSAADVGPWFTSDVALTLAAMGTVLIPALLIPYERAIRRGRALRVASGGSASTGGPAAWFLVSIFGVALGSAIISSLIIHALGWALGSVVAIAVVAFIMGARQGPYHFIHQRLFPTAESASGRTTAPGNIGASAAKA